MSMSNLLPNLPGCLQVSQDGKALLDVLQRPLSPGNSESLTATANYSKAVSLIYFGASSDTDERGAALSRLY